MNRTLVSYIALFLFIVGGATWYIIDAIETQDESYYVEFDLIPPFPQHRYEKYLKEEEEKFRRKIEALMPQSKVATDRYEDWTCKHRVVQHETIYKIGLKYTETDWLDIAKANKPELKARYKRVCDELDDDVREQLLAAESYVCNIEKSDPWMHFLKPGDKLRVPCVQEVAEEPHVVNCSGKKCMYATASTRR